MWLSLLDSTVLTVFPYQPFSEALKKQGQEDPTSKNVPQMDSIGLNNCGCLSDCCIDETATDVIASAAITASDNDLSKHPGFQFSSFLDEGADLPKVVPNWGWTRRNFFDPPKNLIKLNRCARKKGGSLTKLVDHSSQLRSRWRLSN